MMLNKGIFKRADTLVKEGVVDEAVAGFIKLIPLRAVTVSPPWGLAHVHLFNIITSPRCAYVMKSTELLYNTVRVFQVEYSLPDRRFTLLLGDIATEDSGFKISLPHVGYVWAGEQEDEEGYVTQKIEFIYDADVVTIPMVTHKPGILRKLIKVWQIHEKAENLFYRQGVRPIDVYKEPFKSVIEGKIKERLGKGFSGFRDYPMIPPMPTEDALSVLNDVIDIVIFFRTFDP